MKKQYITPLLDVIEDFDITIMAGSETGSGGTYIGGGGDGKTDKEETSTDATGEDATDDDFSVGAKGGCFTSWDD